MAIAVYCGRAACTFINAAPGTERAARGDGATFQRQDAKAQSREEARRIEMKRQRKSHLSSSSLSLRLRALRAFALKSVAHARQTPPVFRVKARGEYK
jgi:hypothetical protein